MTNKFQLNIFCESAIRILEKKKTIEYRQLPAYEELRAIKKGDVIEFNVVHGDGICAEACQHQHSSSCLKSFIMKAADPILIGKISTDLILDEISYCTDPWRESFLHYKSQKKNVVEAMESMSISGGTDPAVNESPTSEWIMINLDF